jgi:hypothetical protein
LYVWNLDCESSGGFGQKEAKWLKVIA